MPYIYFNTLYWVFFVLAFPTRHDHLSVIVFCIINSFQKFNIFLFTTIYVSALCNIYFFVTDLYRFLLYMVYMVLSLVYNTIIYTGNLFYVITSYKFHKYLNIFYVLLFICLAIKYYFFFYRCSYLSYAWYTIIIAKVFIEQEISYFLVFIYCIGFSILIIIPQGIVTRLHILIYFGFPLFLLF